MKIRTVISGIAAALSLLAVTATPVSADPAGPSERKLHDREDPSIDDLPSETALMPQSGDGPVAPAALPSGCWGNTQAPYKGGLTDVFGYARTYCPTTYPEIYVSSTLARSRWYGWQGLDNASERNFYQFQADVDLAAYCFNEGTYDYRVTSYHEVHTSQILSANTNNHTNSISC